MSFHEIFATWLAGGLLVIVPETSRRQADELLEIIQRESIERIFIPFIGLQLLAETAVTRNAYPTSLRECRLPANSFASRRRFETSSNTWADVLSTTTMGRPKRMS